MTRLSVTAGKVVGGGPVLGAVLGAPIDGVGLERFERDRGVAEIFEAQLVEIVAADIDVEVVAPIVLHALVDDVAAGRELLDAVGPLPSGGSSVVAPMSRFLPFLSVPSHQCLRQDR